MTRFARLTAALSMLGSLLMVATPASADSSLAIGNAVRSGASITVSGTLALASDALGPITVGQDPAGDATGSGVGVDLGDATITAQLAPANRLIYSVAIRDGNATLGGPPPATGIGWPINVNGESANTPWLGAGTAGTNFPPRTAAWGALCTVSSGWSCTNGLTATVTKDAVTWTVPFTKTSPPITPGATVETGSAYAGTVATFGWPSGLVFFATAPYDTLGYVSGIVVPGKVELGIAPAGKPEADVTYTGVGAFNASTGAFSGTVAAPTAPGSYTLWAKSCYGLSDQPTCLIASRDTTI